MKMIPLSPLSLAGNSQQSLLWVPAFVLLTCLPVHGQTKSTGFLNVKRSYFPNDFVFGVSTAAAQIEGATDFEGKGPSVWDQLVRKFPDKIQDRSTLNVAVDSYKRYKQDVLALKDLGLDSYRFSIPWTRILPDGTLRGGINRKGINHYNGFINELIKNGIKPFVILLHFDSPEALENKYGGFLNRTIVEDFKDYAEICFKEFGDRVKNWITINEPLIIAKLGYALGIAPPSRCSDRKKCLVGDSAIEPYIATHNILLAHATVAKLYKQKYQAKQGGQIGISLVGKYSEPYSNTQLDKNAAKRSLDFELGWFMEPLVRGKYPTIMCKIVRNRLPKFTAKEKELVKGSFDFIGINYYTSRYAKHIPIDLKATPVSYLVDPYVNSTVDRNGVLIGPNAGGSAFIYVYPEGLYKLLKFMWKTYDKNLKIYITENGFTEKRNDKIPIHQVLNDQNRIEFILKHLYQLNKAIKNGVNVKGYFYWSLVDDFEWIEGYTIGYGLYYVDHNFKRIPKKSAEWYHDFVRGIGYKHA